MKKFIKPYFDYVETFLEAVMQINPNSEIITALVNIKHLKDSVSKSDDKFLDIKKLNEYENNFYSSLIYWNNKISTQADTYQKTISAIAKSSINKSKGNFFDPLSTFRENREKYLLAEDFTLSIIRSVNGQKLDDVKMASLFYTFIALHDGIEYYFKQPLVRGIEQYSHLANQYSIEKIFYVDTIRKGNDNKDYADTDLIRNALAHFNFSIQSTNEENMLIFFPNSESTFRYTYKEFLEFLSQYRFLIQTLCALLSLKICLTQIRRFFVKDKIS